MLKQKARSRLKNKQTVLKTAQNTQLKLKPLKKRPLRKKAITPPKKRFTAKHLKNKKILNIDLFSKLTNLQSIQVNFKLFSLSILLYFFLFVFLDQVSPETIANMPASQAYLPFHLVLFTANTVFLASFLSLENSLLVAFLLELIIFFKLQGFLVDVWLMSSVVGYVLLIKLVLILIRKLRLVRKIKTIKLKPTTHKARKRKKRVVN